MARKEETVSKHQGACDKIVNRFRVSSARILARAQELLADAGYPAAAASLDPALLAAALDAVRAHVEQEGDLRSYVIAQGVLVA